MFHCPIIIQFYNHFEINVNIKKPYTPIVGAKGFTFTVPPLLRHMSYLIKHTNMCITYNGAYRLGYYNFTLHLAGPFTKAIIIRLPLSPNRLYSSLLLLFLFIEQKIFLYLIPLYNIKYLCQ